jgi:hypothetical protein
MRSQNTIFCSNALPWERVANNSAPQTYAIPVGAWLAREEAGTSNTPLRRTTAFANKLGSHENRCCPATNTAPALTPKAVPAAMPYVACDQNIEPSKMKN